MRSSQEIPRTPDCATRRVQKVFPAPDMPISASRNGFARALTVLVVMFVMKMRGDTREVPIIIIGDSQELALEIMIRAPDRLPWGCLNSGTAPFSVRLRAFPKLPRFPAWTFFSSG